MSNIQITNKLCLKVLDDLKIKYPEIEIEINELINNFFFLPIYAKEILIIYAQNREKGYLELSEDNQQKISVLCTKHNIGNINHQIFLNEIHSILNK